MKLQQLETAEGEIVILTRRLNKVNSESKYQKLAER